jgi:hypothetical protein
LKWRATAHLLLRRGPYVIAAGLDETISTQPKQLRGRFIDLFDPALPVRRQVTIEPGQRYFLRDLDLSPGENLVLAAACKTLLVHQRDRELAFAVEGVARTPAVVLLRARRPPRAVTLDGATVETLHHSAQDGLLWVKFVNESRPRTLRLQF